MNVHSDHGAWWIPSACHPRCCHARCYVAALTDQENRTGGRRANRAFPATLGTMELLGFVAMFTGLALLAALPLMVLLAFADSGEDHREP